MDIKTRITLPILWLIEKHMKRASHPFNEPGDMWENLYLWQHKTTEKTLSHFRISLEDKVVVDIGCGTGGKSAYLAGTASKVIGIDINPHSIRKGKALIKKHHPHLQDKVELRVDNAYDMHIPDSSIDIVFMDDVWEHIAKPSKALRESIRILKPGGYILLAFPPLNHPWAAHVNDLIPIPWIHYFLWEKYIVRWYIYKAIQTNNGIERLKFKGIKPYDKRIHYINRMTLHRTLAILHKYKEQIDIVDFSYDLLKVPFARVLSKFESIGLFFFSKYYFTLQKRDVS